jgi:hypothetical protein
MNIIISIMISVVPRVTVCTCLVIVPPVTFTMEASKPKTGFINSTTTLMLASFVMLGELVRNTTPGFVESKRKI